MSAEVWAALIGGVSGVISAWVTSLLTTRGAAAASTRDDRRRSQFVAVQVGPTLRQFAETCLAASYDDGCDEGRPAGEGGEAEATVRVDPFKRDDIQGVDWQSLPAALMVDILTFEQKHQVIGVELSDWHAYYDPPDHPEYFSDRQWLYVGLGIDAIALGIRLFKETGHTSSLPGAAELQERLQARKSELDKERHERARRRAAYVPPPLPAAPPASEPAAI